MSDTQTKKRSLRPEARAASRASPLGDPPSRMDLRIDLGEEIARLKNWMRSKGIPINLKVRIANSIGHLAARSNELIRDTDMERLRTRLDALEKALGLAREEVVVHVKP